MLLRMYECLAEIGEKWQTFSDAHGQTFGDS